MGSDTLGDRWDQYLECKTLCNLPNTCSSRSIPSQGPCSIWLICNLLLIQSNQVLVPVLVLVQVQVWGNRDGGAEDQLVQALVSFADDEEPKVSVQGAVCVGQELVKDSDVYVESLDGDGLQSHLNLVDGDALNVACAVLHAAFA